MMNSSEEIELYFGLVSFQFLRENIAACSCSPEMRSISFDRLRTSFAINQGESKSTRLSF
jgi:hypothetical protein